MADERAVTVACRRLQGALRRRGHVVRHVRGATARIRALRAAEVARDALHLHALLVILAALRRVAIVGRVGDGRLCLHLHLHQLQSTRRRARGGLLRLVVGAQAQSLHWSACALAALALGAVRPKHRRMADERAVTVACRRLQGALRRRGHVVRHVRGATARIRALRAAEVARDALHLHALLVILAALRRVAIVGRVGFDGVSRSFLSRFGEGGLRDRGGLHHLSGGQVLFRIRADAGVSDGVASAGAALAVHAVRLEGGRCAHEGAVGVTRYRLQGALGLGGDALRHVRRASEAVLALRAAEVARHILDPQALLVVLATLRGVAVVRRVNRGGRAEQRNADERECPHHAHSGHLHA